MKTPRLFNSWYWVVILSILIFSLFLRIPNINRPLLDAHYFRQTQTATVVRNFTLTGIDLFQTKLDIFGDGKEQVLLLEFPFFQAITAIVSNFLGFHDYVGRLVSLLFGIASGLVLLLLTNKLFQNKYTGLCALVFFIFNPLNFYFQQAYLIESTVIFLHLLSIILWVKYAEIKRKNWLVFASIITAIASIQKNVYAPFLLITILSILFIKLSKREFKKFHWFPGILFSIFTLLVWQYYIDLTNFSNGHSNFTIGDPSQSLWNFGTITERFDIRVWFSRLNFIQNSVTKYQWPMFLVGLILLTFRKIKAKQILLSWLFSMILYYLVLFRIQSHDYYFMLVLPVFSIIAGYGLSEMAKLVKNKYLIASVIGIYLILFAYKSIQNSRLYFNIDDKMKDRLNTYNSVIKKDGHILFVLPDYSWNSVYTYYTKRKGMVIAANWASVDIISKLKTKGYRYVVIDGVSVPETLKNYKKLISKDNLVILEI